jgi:hypothetical protein
VVLLYTISPDLRLVLLKEISLKKGSTFYIFPMFHYACEITQSFTLEFYPLKNGDEAFSIVLPKFDSFVDCAVDTLNPRILATSRVGEKLSTFIIKPQTDTKILN